jgi:uncharacterized protein (TIGR03083 family)
VASFTDEQWAHASRCEGWPSRAVISHLDSTNTFWAYSIAAGLRGEPTRFLATFDPVASPAQLVAATDGDSTSDVLDRFMASSESLVDLLASLDDADWSVLAEAPPGHLSVSAVAHHALWDSWVHERDILLPMGVSPDEEADEIAASLRYVAALGPALAVNRGTVDRGVLAVDVTGPDVSIVVEIDEQVVVRSGRAETDLRLTGDAVELLEALSVRRPLDQPIPSASSWLLSGLSEAFTDGSGAVAAK